MPAGARRVRFSSGSVWAGENGKWMRCVVSSVGENKRVVLRANPGCHLTVVDRLGKLRVYALSVATFKAAANKEHFISGQ